MRVGIALQLEHEIAQMVVLIDAALANHRVLLDLLELVAYFLALQVRAATLAATHRQLVARNPSLTIETAPERNLSLHASKLVVPVVLHHGEEFRWFESAGHLFLGLGWCFFRCYRCFQLRHASFERGNACLCDRVARSAGFFYLHAMLVRGCVC